MQAKAGSRGHGAWRKQGTRLDSLPPAPCSGPLFENSAVIVAISCQPSAVSQSSCCAPLATRAVRLPCIEHRASSIQPNSQLSALRHRHLRVLRVLRVSNSFSFFLEKRLNETKWCLILSSSVLRIREDSRACAKYQRTKRFHLVASERCWNFSRFANALQLNDLRSVSPRFFGQNPKNLERHMQLS
jgi:hypothetical protein